MNKLDNFEKLMQSSLDDFEMAYDPKQWDALKQKLDAPSGGSKFPWLAVAAVTGIVTLSAVAYNFFSSTDKSVDTLAANKSTTITFTPDKNNSNPNFNNEQLVVKSDNNTSDDNKTENITTLNENNRPVVNEVKTVDAVIINPNKNNTTNTTINKTITDINKDVEVIDATTSSDLAIKLPSPQLALSQNEVCLGEEVKVEVTNLPAQTKCIWKINGEVVRNNSSSSFINSFENAGIYHISVQYDNGKLMSQPVEKLVSVKTLPEVDFTWENEVVNGKPNTIFVAKGDFEKLTWSFANGSTSSKNNTAQFYRHKGTYPVKLTVSGLNKCQTTIQKSVVIDEEYNLFAPNAISPNGDGRNDVFIPSALTIMDVEFNMSIFTRDGRLVYQTNSAFRPWDGKFTSDNQDAPEGVYVWVVSIKGEESYKGSVTLIR